MNKEHTPTPWHFSEREFSAAIMGPMEVPAKLGRPNSRPILVAQFGLYTDEETNPEANARHAVACVNACQGLDPKSVPHVVETLRTIEKRIRGTTTNNPGINDLLRSIRDLAAQTLTTVENK